MLGLNSLGKSLSFSPIYGAKKSIFNVWIAKKNKIQYLSLQIRFLHILHSFQPLRNLKFLGGKMLSFFGPGRRSVATTAQFHKKTLHFRPEILDFYAAERNAKCAELNSVYSVKISELYLQRFRRNLRKTKVIPYLPYNCVFFLQPFWLIWLENGVYLLKRGVKTHANVV